MTSSSKLMTSSSASVRPGLASQALRKVIGVGVHAFSAWSRLAYRATPPWRGKLSYVDHVTIPCQDLGVAEEFYVGLLGARVALRLDAHRLERLGWSRQAIEENHAAHLQLTLGGGPRLDVFEYPAGVPVAPMHPHIALARTGASGASSLAAATTRPGSRSPLVTSLSPTRPPVKA